MILDVPPDTPPDDNNAMQNGSTNQSAEILARRPDFVPTAFDESADGKLAAGPDWMTAMKWAIRSTSQLRQILALTNQEPPSERDEPEFRTFVPWEFLRRIRPGDHRDPLLLQVLPQAAEWSQQPEGYSADPVGDLQAVAAGGVLHKYHGRALVITAAACGVHCRYCFRREFPYQTEGSRSDNWQPSIDYLRENESIDEVILSGGDPLTVTDEKLDQLISQLETIAHLKRLRVHSRMPIVIPQRVTAELVERLRSSRLAVWMVVHANHPNELDADVLGRLGMLVDAGIPVLNQAVLLRGVNDRADVLTELCRTLVDHRIVPYYLHQLDRVRGASHFEVPIREGEQLMNQLRASLPGYAVPTYVVEQAGGESKTPLTTP